MVRSGLRRCGNATAPSGARLAVDVKGASSAIVILGIPAVVVFGVVLGLIRTVAAMAPRASMALGPSNTSRGIKCLGSFEALDLSLLLTIGRLGLLEDGEELFALQRSCQRRIYAGLVFNFGAIRSDSKSVVSTTYGADDLARIVDNGDGLFQRHDGRAAPNRWFDPPKKEKEEERGLPVAYTSSPLSSNSRLCRKKKQSGPVSGLSAGLRLLCWLWNPTLLIESVRIVRRRIPGTDGAVQVPLVSVDSAELIVARWKQANWQVEAGMMGPVNQGMRDNGIVMRDASGYTDNGHVRAVITSTGESS